MAKELKVKFPDGTDGWVAETDVEGVLKDYPGSKVVSAAEAQASEQPVRAGVEAGARALTFGLSDAVGRGLGADPKMQEKRADENPTAKVVGEIGGTVAGLFVPGSAPANAAKLGRLARAGGTGVGAAARAGVAEGGLLGLSQFVGEEMLHPDADVSTTSERLAGSVLGGAITGGAFSAGAFGVGKAVGAIAKKVKAVDIADDLSRAADEVVKNRLKLDVSDEVMDYAKARGILSNAMSAESVAQHAVGEVAKDAAAQVALRDSLNNRTVDAEAAKVLRSAFKDLQEEFAKNPKNANMLKRVSAELDQMLREKPRPGVQVPEPVAAPAPKASKAGSVEPTQVGGDGLENTKFRPGSRQAQALGPVPRPKGVGPAAEPAAPPREFEWASPTGPKPVRKAGNRYYDVEGNVPELEGTKNARVGVAQAEAQAQAGVPGVEFESRAVHILDWLEGRVAQGATLGRRSNEQALVNKLRKSFIDYLGDEGALYSKVTDDLHLGQQLLEAVQDGVNVATSPFDGVMGAALGGAAFGPKGVLLGAANKLAKDRGPFVAARVMRSPWTLKAAEGLKRHLESLLEVGPAVLGRFTGPVSQMAALGGYELLDAHAKLAKSESGDDYLATLGLQKEQQEHVNALDKRLSVVTAMSEQLAAQDKRIADSLQQSASTGLAGAPVLSAEEVTKIVANLVAAQQSDPTGADALNGAPGVSVNALVKGGELGNWLLSKAPKNPNEGLPQALRSKWAPNTADRRAFTRYVLAAQDPYRLVDELKAGVVHPETLDTVKNMFPRVYMDIQQKMTERLSEWKGTLPTKRRDMIAQTLGLQLNGLSPQQMTVLQQVHAKQGEQNGGQSAGPDGRQVVNQQKNMQTQAQRLEGRGAK